MFSVRPPIGHSVLLILLLLVCSMARAAGPFHGQVGIAIEQTFGTGNPESLKLYLNDEAKIYVSIPIAGIPGGKYSKNQLVTTIKQMFERVTTRSFSLQGGKLPTLSRDPIRAIWKFSFNDTGETIETTLYFTISSNPLDANIKSIRGE